MEQIVGALAFAVRCERERGLRARHRAAETRNRSGTAIAIGHSTTNGLATTNNVNNGESESKVCKGDNRLGAGNVGGWLEGGTAGR